MEGATTLMSNDCPLMLAALREASLRRGCGVVLAVLDAMARSHACKIEDTSHGFFFKAFYAQTRANEKGSRNAHSISSTSTTTPLSSPGSAVVKDSPINMPIAKSTLLRQRQAMKLSRPTDYLPVKNTFVEC